MKKRSYIVRFFGLFMLAFVLLNSLTPARAMVKKQLIASQSHAKEDGNHADDVTISEWSADVVVPSNAFHFSNDVVIIPAPAFDVIFDAAITPVPANPLYRISYFDKLFEHHIAINAP